MKLAALSLFFLAPCMAMIQDKFHIDGESLSVPQRLKQLAIYHEENEFHVIKDGADSIVKSHRMDSLLRKLKQNRPELKSYLESSGYLTVGESEDGELSLSSNARIRGGGPLLCGLLYVGVKTIGYTAMLCGAGAISAVSVASGPGGPGVAGAAIGIVTASGGTAAMLGSIETAAVSAGCWGLAIPWF